MRNLIAICSMYIYGLLTEHLGLNHKAKTFIYLVSSLLYLPFCFVSVARPVNETLKNAFLGGEIKLKCALNSFLGKYDGR